MLEQLEIKQRPRRSCKNGTDVVAKPARADAVDSTAIQAPVRGSMEKETTLEAPPISREDPPSRSLAAFIEGTSPISLAPTMLGEDGETFAAMAAPLTEGLVRADSLAVATARRMLAEMAAQSHVNWGLLTAKMRALHSQPAGSSLKELAHYAKEVDRAFKQTATALELLQRPGPSNLNIQISAANVNFGDQMIGDVPEAQVAQKPRWGKSIK